ncbi:MAG: hypothetical protein WKF79_04570 [Nocardioides sp.]
MFDAEPYVKAEIDYRRERAQRSFARSRRNRARSPFVRRPDESRTSR